MLPISCIDSKASRNYVSYIHMLLLVMSLLLAAGQVLLDIALLTSETSQPLGPYVCPSTSSGKEGSGS